MCMQMPPEPCLTKVDDLCQQDADGNEQLHKAPQGAEAQSGGAARRRAEE
jgi:hypothetical protein